MIKGNIWLIIRVGLCLFGIGWNAWRGLIIKEWPLAQGFLTGAFLLLMGVYIFIHFRNKPLQN